MNKPDYEQIFNDIEGRVKESFKNAKENEIDLTVWSADDVAEDMQRFDGELEGIPLDVLTVIVKRIMRES